MEKEQLLSSRRSEEASRFFHQSDATADFDHWAKSPYWSLKEAISLLFGKEPEVVNWERLKSITKISPFAANYSKLLDLANRACTAGTIEKFDSPARFLLWADGIDHPVPESLVESCNKYANEGTDWKVQYKKLKVMFDQRVTMHEELEATFDLNTSTATKVRSEGDSGLGEYWAELQSKARLAISDYPEWSSTQRKVQKAGNLLDWLKADIGADNREAEIIKKVLSERFKM